LYIFFWVFPRRQILVGRRFKAFEDGTDTGFRNVGQLQFDAGEYPEENIQYSNHGESLKSSIAIISVYRIFIMNEPFVFC